MQPNHFNGIHLILFFPLHLACAPTDPTGDDGRVEQGAGSATSPGTKRGKTRPAGGEVQAAAVPEERYETESRDYVFYRSRTICSVSMSKTWGLLIG